MTERRKFGEFKQNRFITVVEVDNSCGIEDLMKQKKYGGFREKDYRKLCSIREELNQLYYENEQLKLDNNRLVNETARIVAEHQGRVLDLIDETIEYYSDKYELYDTNAIDVLEELKKELCDG